MSPEPQVRIERDSLGEVPVPVTARYGAQTSARSTTFRSAAIGCRAT